MEARAPQSSTYTPSFPRPSVSFLFFRIHNIHTQQYTQDNTQHTTTISCHNIIIIQLQQHGITQPVVQGLQGRIGEEEAGQAREALAEGVREELRGQAEVCLSSHVSFL